MFKVGILGAGGMGNAHARHYRNMADVDLTFFDPMADRAKTFEERHGCSASASPEALIAGCDVVDVCLPTDLHLEFGLRAIAAGKAVFMEKPITRTLAEARQLNEAAAKAGVPLMPGQVVRFFPEYAAAHKRVVSGAIGTPAAVRTRRGGGAPMSGAGNWFMDFERSGGVLLDLAIHDFDWLRWTFGEVKHLYARSVAAMTGGGPDYGLTTLTFDSGVIGHVEATWMDPSGFRTAFEVCGSEGMIEHDSRNTPPLRLHQPGKSIADNLLAPSDDPYSQELRGFLDAVRDGTEPPVSGYEGLMSLSIALAALESAKTGMVVVPERG
jgi:UDP-N-acetylglucosamine 3-dehydrogenase